MQTFTEFTAFQTACLVGVQLLKNGRQLVRVYIILYYNTYWYIYIIIYMCVYVCMVWYGMVCNGMEWYVME